MVQFFGRTESTDVQDDTLTTVFRIPAFSEAMVRRRASINIRAKDLLNADIQGVEEVAPGDIPGQTIYDVTVTSDR